MIYKENSRVTGVLTFLDFRWIHTSGRWFNPTMCRHGEKKLYNSCKRCVRRRGTCGLGPKPWLFWRRIRSLTVGSCIMMDGPSCYGLQKDGLDMSFCQRMTCVVLRLENKYPQFIPHITRPPDCEQGGELLRNPPHIAHDSPPNPVLRRKILYETVVF